MKTRTVKSLVGATIVVSFLCTVTGTALAGTLLSGYGGPGEGNQAILGGGLVNLPSGGGPPAGAPGGSSLSQAPASGSSSKTGAGGKGSGSSGKARGSRTGKGGRTSTGGAGSDASQAADRPSAAAEAPQGSSVGSQALGLSGADLLYILLAVGALAVTALLTRQLTRGAGGGASG